MNRLLLHLELLRWRATLALGNWKLQRLIERARKSGMPNLPDAPALLEAARRATQRR